MLIKNGQVFIDGAYHKYDVEIQDGMISRIGQGLEGVADIDAAGKYVFAGFIESHIHGNAFLDCGEGEEAMRKICAAMPQYGITGIVPTPNISYVEAALPAVRGIRAAKGAPGADILGINFYGPYRHRTIAHYPISIPPTKEHTLAMMDNDLSDVRIITVAPELPGAMEWIKWITDQGIIAMIAFTEATTKQIYEAADNGATLTDHFFNGFPLMDHHEEGSTIGCLLEDRLYCQMLLDHIHVSEPFVRLAIRIKGVDKIVAVHDGSTFVGAPDGEYIRGTDPTHPSYKLIKKDGAVRTVAGKLQTGCHSFDENMRTMLDKGYSREDIGSIFAENAAKALRLDDRGKIEVGRRGDIVIMDEGFYVKKTIILGETVFEA